MRFLQSTRIDHQPQPGIAGWGRCQRSTTHPSWGISLQELPVVRESRQVAAFNDLERVGEGHLPEPVIVAVALPVRGDVRELRPGALGAENLVQPVGERVPTPEQVFEGNGLGDRSMVKEGGNGSPRKQPDGVGRRRIDPFPGYIPPLCVPQISDSAGLPRCQNGEADSIRGEDRKGLQINSRLGQPHALGRPAEPVGEVSDAPYDLGVLVSCRRQRQDQMVICLGQSQAVAGETPLPLPVGLAASLGDLRACDSSQERSVGPKSKLIPA